MHSKSINHRKMILAALAAFITVTPLSGCFNPLGGNTKPAFKVQEPPYIPPPPAPETATEIKPTNLTDIRAYADLLETGDTRKHHPRLVTAISNAIQAGVLKPASLEERFEPDRSITYGEFRDWTLAWQNALAEAGHGIQAAPDGTPIPTQRPVKKDPKQPRELSAFKRDSLNSPMNPDKLMVLSAHPPWAEAQLSANQSLSREQLAALYVFLTRQEQKARTLSPEQVETANPDGNPMNLDESLAQFKDYPAISPWAKPYVAVAYRDRLLQRVFRLTPDKLTVDEGFQPRAEVNREQAILLLDHLYGRYRVSGRRPQPEAGPAAGESEAKTPIATQSTYTETGPGYSRKTSRITVPR